MRLIWRLRWYLPIFHILLLLTVFIQKLFILPLTDSLILHHCVSPIFSLLFLIERRFMDWFLFTHWLMLVIQVHIPRGVHFFKGWIGFSHILWSVSLWVTRIRGHKIFLNKRVILIFLARRWMKRFIQLGVDIFLFVVLKPIQSSRQNAIRNAAAKGI